MPKDVAAGHTWHVINVQKIFVEEPAGMLSRFQKAIGVGTAEPQVRIEFPINGVVPPTT